MIDRPTPGRRIDRYDDDVETREVDEAYAVKLALSRRKLATATPRQGQRTMEQMDETAARSGARVQAGQAFDRP